MDTNTVLTAFDILNNVNAYYDTSWNHLILYTGALAVVIGVIVPILIQYYQTRLFHIEEAGIQRSINDKMSELKCALTEQLVLDFQKMQERIKDELTQLEVKVMSNLSNLEKKSIEQIQSFKEETQIGIMKVEGNLFHVQSNFYALNGAYPAAVESLLTGLLSEAKSRDELNLQRGISSLIKYLSEVTKAQWDKFPKIKTKGNLLLDSLSAINENERYSEAIDNVRAALSQAENRKSKEV